MKKVSIIIPVHNNSDGLDKLLSALVHQSYPKDFFEIIVVDNGSNDRSLDVAKKYEETCKDQIRVLIENSVLSSYAARNMGISNAEGQIIAMIDSDCTPLPDWIEKGVLGLDTYKADLLGGNVKFIFPPKPGAAEMCDSIFSMQMKYTIPNRGSCATANLFARRTVFDTIGLFPPKVKSGGDVIWTKKATTYGFKLEYSQEIVVLHPTRNLKELLRKQFRIGRGRPEIWRVLGRNKHHIFLEILRDFLPRPLQNIKFFIDERGTPEMQNFLWSIWSTAWLCRVIKNFGTINNLLGTCFQRRNN